MKTLIILSIAAFCGCSVASAAEPPPKDLVAADRIIDAIKTNDLEKFTTDGEPAFVALTKEQLAAVSAQLSPRLEKGFETTYLGRLKQAGYTVTLWRLRFNDGGDDALATLSTEGRQSRRVSHPLSKESNP